MNNAEHIINRIKSEEITPTPGWVFSARNVLIWLCFVLAIILGALAFSVILLALQQADFSITAHLSHSHLELFLGLLPFIWLVLVVIFLALAIVSIQYSKKGYKFSAFRMFSISVLLSIAIGTFFFLAGGSEKLEQIFEVNLTSYKSIEERKLIVWNRPDEGFLAGKIQDIDEEYIYLKDFNNQEWTISYAKSFIARAVELASGETIKVIGEKTDSNKFTADEIRPWGGKRPGPGMQKKADLKKQD